MIAAAVAPARMRATSSHENEGASPHSDALIAHATHAQATTMYLPKRSPTGPKKSCDRPYATAKTVITCDASPSGKLNSEARLGSNASLTRSDDALPNAASDKARKAVNGTGGCSVRPRIVEEFMHHEFLQSRRVGHAGG